LDILREQDDTRLAVTAEHVRNAVVAVGKMHLRLYKQFSEGTRILRYTGESNEILVMQWKASDLSSDDVVIENTNELTETPAQKAQKVRDYLQYGLFNDPETGKIDPRMRARILEMEQFGTWDEAFDVEALHRKKALSENYFVENNRPIEVDIYDDHELHYAEHMKLRLTTDYTHLREENPEMAAMFDAHIMEHEQGKFTKRKALVDEEMALQPAQPVPMQ